MLGVDFDGGLSQLAPAVASPGRPTTISRSPDGRFVYTPGIQSPVINGYAVNPTTGILTSLGPAFDSQGANSRYLTFTPDQDFAYVSNGSSGNIGIFSVDNGGSLIPLGVQTVGGNFTNTISIRPAGDRLYLTRRITDTVEMFDINGDGSLSPITPAVSSQLQPSGILFSQTRDYAYVASDTTSDLQAFRVETNGDLTLLTPQSLFPTTVGPINFAAVHPSQPVLYVVERNSAQQPADMAVFEVELDGTLTLLDSEDAGVGAGEPVLNADGSYLYVANAAGDVRMFAVESDGGLTPLGTFTDGDLDGTRDGVSVGAGVNPKEIED